LSKISQQGTPLSFLCHTPEMIIPPALARCGEIEESNLPAWNEVIGFRNRIVHDYMNIDKGKVIEWVMSDSEKFIMEFLLKTIEDKGNS
jgi:uncharacterized protein YutE (UPF0331/DUF86 family)